MSSSIQLKKEMLNYFFRKRAEENDNIYKIFVGVEGNENMNLEEERYENCTITFHFSNYDDMTGEVKKYLSYKKGRTILSYIKSMICYLVEERKMTDFGHFCVIVF